MPAASPFLLLLLCLTLSQPSLCRTYRARVMAAVVQQKWTKGLDLFDKKIVLFPINSA